MASEIWRTYRRFRRSALVDAKLREYLGAELSALRTIDDSDAGFRPEVWLAQQSARSLAESAQEGLDALETLVDSLSPNVLDDLGELETGISRRLPDLDREVLSEALGVLRAHGTPRAYLQTLQSVWAQRRDVYEECVGMLASASQSPAKAAIAVAERLGESRRVPEDLLTHRPVWELDPSAIAGQLDDARRERDAELRAGRSTVLADGAIKALAMKASGTSPEIARDLGIADEDIDDPTFFLCLIVGFGWAVCVIVFVIAISSHDVEEDDGDTTTGD
jgi:hypothetical protein